MIANVDNAGRIVRERGRLPAKMLRWCEGTREMVRFLWIADN
jgi:hypothetical protein